MGTITTIKYNNASIIETSTSTSVPIQYDDKTIATMYIGDNKTLMCADKYMKTDVIIGGKQLYCGGKMMGDNIDISVETDIVEPVSYIIYQSGSSSINYGTISTGDSNGALLSSVDGSYGYYVGTECIEAYAGYRTKNLSSGLGMTPTSDVYAGNGTWKLILDTSKITAPGVLYITASRNSYSGTNKWVTINGSMYDVQQGWEIGVQNGNSDILSVSPGTSEYTYSCDVPAPQEGITIVGLAGVVGTGTVNTYVTKIEYVANAQTVDDGTYNIFGNGVYGENIAWQNDTYEGAGGSSCIESNNILQVVDSNGSSGGYGVVTFLNNRQDTGFDFTGYSKLNIETTKVVHQNVASGYACSITYGAINSYSHTDAEDYIVLTAHSSGTVINSMDISNATGIKYIHVRANDTVLISRVWLSK